MKDRCDEHLSINVYTSNIIINVYGALPTHAAQNRNKSFWQHDIFLTIGTPTLPNLKTHSSE